jgi:hypothetical protein
VYNTNVTVLVIFCQRLLFKKKQLYPPILKQFKYVIVVIVNLIKCLGMRNVLIINVNTENIYMANLRYFLPFFGVIK